MKITTEMCKKYIQEYFKLDSNVSIKRVKKYKDSGTGLTARDFVVGNGEQCTLLENTKGELEIISGTSVSPVRIFTDAEKKEAKDFIKSWTKKIENSNLDMEDCLVAISGLSDKFILASQFVFNFPEEMYENEDFYITNGLDTPFKIPNGDGLFCITFIDRNGSDIDICMSDTIKDILPTYLIDLDEYHYGLSNMSFAGTVRVLTA